MRIAAFDRDFEDEPGLPLTPLIDIIFLLLIFYISIGRLHQVESMLALNLPTAGSAEPGERTMGDVIVNVDAQGTISVNYQPMEAEELEEKLTRLAEIFPGQSVIIRSDSDCKWEDVAAVLDACSSADIWNIKFAVTPKDD